MARNNKKKSGHQEKQKRRFLDIFLTREEPDEDYMPDLKNQWTSMDQKDRIIFILGALFGLIIILGGLILIYILISSLGL